MRRGLFYGQTAFFRSCRQRGERVFVETAFLDSAGSGNSIFLSGETEIFSGVQYRCAQ
jgi:hypothetical protein